MSQHPSLRSQDKDKQHRSVLKRYERLKVLKDKERWKETDSVFGLQKVKVLRFKIKKEKVAKEAEVVEGAVPGLEAAPGSVAAPAPGQVKGTPQVKAGPSKDAAKPKSPAGETKKEPKK